MSTLSRVWSAWLRALSTVPGAAAAIVVIVALAVTVVITHRGSAAAADSERAGQDALKSLHQRVPSMLSYDYRTMDRDIEVMAGNATGAFGREYLDLLQTRILPTVQKKKAVTTTTIVRVGISSQSPRRVRALVLLSQSTTSGKGKAKTSASRVEVLMSKTDEGWAVAGLASV